jgi:pimeloyl-ACP methyl ester carboxylesterase
MNTKNPSFGMPTRHPILLIHGLAASRHDWSYLDPALKAAGYQTYSLDLLGHGDGYRPEKVEHYQYESLQRDFITWVDSLMLDSPPVLVGHSLGGYLALDYALHAGRPINGLLLIAPFYSRRQLSALMRLFYRLPFFGALGMRLAPQWLIQFGIDIDPIDGQFLSSKARHQMAEDTKRASPQIYYLPRSFPDLTSELSKITVSSLVIWGENDHTLNPSSFPTLVEAMPAARGYAVPVIGHQPHLGKSEIVNTLALEFLKNIPHAPVKTKELPVAMD